MTWAKENIFQRLVRQWDQLHPYNAAQVMHLSGAGDVARLTVAWRETLAELGLGRVRSAGGLYRFESLNGDAEQCIVPRFVAAETSLEALLTRELNRRFDLEQDYPLRPFVLEQADGTHFAGVVYHHWIADSASIRLLMREWFYRLYDPSRARRRPLVIPGDGYWGHFNPERARWRFGEGLLSSLRWSSRMKRVRRVEMREFDQYQTHVTLHRVPDGLVEALRRAAQRRGATLNDLFLAAVAELCGAFDIVHRTRRRQDLALGTIVDLRKRAVGRDMSDVFGLFLGFASVVCRPRDLRGDFDRLLQRVAVQNRLNKRSGVPEASMIRIFAGLVAHRWLGPEKVKQFYRKRLPLAGGVSNVNLNGSWVEPYHPNPLLDYLRVSPSGPMMPLVFTPTTIGSQMNFGVTCRESVVSVDRAMQISQRFRERLMQFARACDL